MKSFGQNCWSVCSWTLLLAARPHRWLSQELPPLALGPGLWGVFWNGSCFKLMFLLLWQNTRQKQLKEANGYVDLQFGKGHSLLLKASHGYGYMANWLHSFCSVKTDINVGTGISLPPSSSMREPHEMILSTFRLGFAFSVKSLWRHPHRCIFQWFQSQTSWQGGWILTETLSKLKHCY